MRMSFEPASDSSADSSNTASSANVVAAMNAILVPTASCLPTGRPHWTRSADHSRAILSDNLPAPAAHRRDRQPSGVERRQGDLEALTLLAEPVLDRDADVVEPGDAVLDALQSHEHVAVLDRDAGRRGLDHEGGDAATSALVLRHRGHHHHQLGDDAVGGPELHSVEDVLLAVVAEPGRGAHPGGVGADVGLGEQEGRDRTAGAPGEVLLLLLVGAEHLDRLGHADGVVRRDRARPSTDAPIRSASARVRSAASTGRGRRTPWGSSCRRHRGR